MSTRARLLRVMVLLLGTAAFAWLLWSVAEATRRLPGSKWVSVVWGVSLALSVMAMGRASRWVRGASAWSVSLALATLSDGPGARSIWSVVSLFTAVGLAQFAGVPLLRPARRSSGELPDIFITDQDLRRLTNLLNQLPPSARAALRDLEREIARATVVPSKFVPPTVVTMNSRLVFEEVESGTRSEAVLVYPRDEDPGEGRISVLAPVGSALLGLSVGQCIEWQLAARHCHFRVLQIKYQPEAAGDYHL